MQPTPPPCLPPRVHQTPPCVDQPPVAYRQSSVEIHIHNDKWIMNVVMVGEMEFCRLELERDHCPLHWTRG